MSWLQNRLNQQATYWEKTGKSTYGDPSFDSPRTILVRWEDKNVVFTNAAGEEAVASSRVFLGEDIRAGDFLFLGVSTTVDPKGLTDAMKVQGFSKIPQLTGGDFERVAFLSAGGA